jgi:hypothetical protein
LTESHDILYGKADDSGEISLAEQERLYEEGFPRAVADTLRDLSSGSYLAYIHDLGLERLRDGFPIFGDEMYHWHPAIRTANADEEMADNLVYRTSDPT